MNKHGGYYGAKQDVIDFSVNINPLGVSKKLEQTIVDGIKQIHKYPEIDGKSTIEYIANHYGLNNDELVLGNGAIDLIYLFARALKPKKVLVIQPTFNEYKRAFKLAGSKIYDYILNTDNFEIDVKELINYMHELKPDVVVICNPNNPTGIYHDICKMNEILEAVKEINSILFVDESFIEFSNKESLIKYVSSYPLFILRSMTKFFAVPGLRLGFGVSNKNIIAKMNEYKEPWSVNYLSLISVPVLLENQGYINKTLDWYKAEKEYVYDNLKELEAIKVYKSSTNFHLCKVKESTAEVLKDKLLKKGIYIRTCEDFAGLDNTFFRLALKKHENNEKLICALKETRLNK